VGFFFKEEGQFFLFIMAGESFFYENGSGPTYALRIIGSGSTAPHLSTREELNLWALLRNVSLKPLVKDKIR
jgi:hypothetical protein